MGQGAASPCARGRVGQDARRTVGGLRSFYLRLARPAGGRVAGAQAKLNPIAVLLCLGIVEHAHRRDAPPPCVALCEAARVFTGRGHGRPAGFPRLLLFWPIDRDARGLALEKGRSVQLERRVFLERGLGAFFVPLLWLEQFWFVRVRRPLYRVNACIRGATCCCGTSALVLPGRAPS